MRRFLRRLKFDRVDLVDQGANPHAHLTLFKRHIENPQISDGIPMVLPTNPPEDSDDMATLLGKREKTPDEPLEEQLEELRKQNEQTEAELKKAKEKLAGSDDGDVVTSQILRKEKEELEGELQELRKAERMRAFINKAADFKTISDPERLGSLLEEADRGMSDDNQEYLGRLLMAAKSAAEVDKTSRIFDQLASVEPVEESWDVKLEKRAKELADSQKITIEQAKMKVMEEDPALRAEYQKARKEQS